ncbi:MAG: efflux RND transporter permease subunit [Rhizomicrobium sp.]
MSISEPFIRKPVMTTLLMAALLIFGAFSYTTLPVSELPNVDFPTINVSASLPGADPETMASAVATPLENQFSNIAGVSSMTSSSSSGTTQITLQFDLDRNIDGAAEDVQAAIQAASRQLPHDMPNPPTLRKENPSDTPILFLSLGSDTMPIYKVDKYAENLLARQISTLNGVSEVDVFGSQIYAVRVQVDPNKLATRGIGIDQVSTALQNSNVDIASGTLNGPKTAAVIHTHGQLEDASQYNNQIIAYQNGAPVRVRDVGHAIDSVENNLVASWYDGQRSVALAVRRQAGSNTIQVVDSIYRILPQFERNLPRGLKLSIVHDHSESIRASVSDVQATLLIAAALVVGVIFVFLRTASATIIPSLALPLAIVGTFAGMALFGYSLDNLSLLALTLSVGFVVDDAIVMLENITRHVEEGEEPHEAALKGSREIGFTILSMTLSLSAVFIPVVFMGGIVGRLLHEFAVTIVIAIVISGVVSVTLTPMLCSRFMKPGKGSHHGGFYKWSERTFDRVQDGYARSLHWGIEHHRIIFGLFLASLLATVGLFMISKEDFIPTSDTGMISGFSEASDSTSFDQMVKYQKEATAIISKDPNIGGVLSFVGGGARTGVNEGRIILHLKPRGDRPLSADQIINELRPKLAVLPGLQVFLQNPPSIRIGGHSTKAEYQYALQGLDQDQLLVYTNKIDAALSKQPGFKDVTSDAAAAGPAVDVQINRDRAAALGVTPNAIETALGAAFGGQQVSTIYGSSSQYWVMLELTPSYQSKAADLDRLYVTSSNGNLVPLSAVTTITSGTMPLVINHLGQLPAVTVSFDLGPGMALSDAVSAIEKVQGKIGLPATISGSFQGTAQAFQSSVSNIGLLLVLAIITVYIILGILYESFIHPLTILSGLPAAAVGALITLYVFNTPLSLYAFVGMIMLIGIVKKNAIMMIDFALTRERGEGIPPEKAIEEAALVRFRPIMMTTMAALMGTLPIAIGFGEGGETRQPLGLAVVGGLVVSQLLTLYITPVIYIYLDELGEKISRWGGAHRAAPQPSPAE